MTEEKLPKEVFYRWTNCREFRVGYGLKDEAIEAFRLSGFKWQPLPLVNYPDFISEPYAGCCDMSVLTAAGFILEKDEK